MSRTSEYTTWTCRPWRLVDTDEFRAALQSSSLCRPELTCMQWLHTLHRRRSHHHLPAACLLSSGYWLSETSPPLFVLYLTSRAPAIQSRRARRTAALTWVIQPVSADSFGTDHIWCSLHRTATKEARLRLRGRIRSYRPLFNLSVMSKLL